MRNSSVIYLATSQPSTCAMTDAHSTYRLTSTLAQRQTLHGGSSPPVQNADFGQSLASARPVRRCFYLCIIRILGRINKAVSLSHLNCRFFPPNYSNLMSFQNINV